MISSLMPSLDKARCEGEEIVLLLAHHLPPDLAYLWLRCDDMQSILYAGGLTTYTTTKQVSNLIRAQKLVMLDHDKYRNRRWFAFPHEEKKYPDPKQQCAAMKQLPQIEANYFTNLKIKFKYIGVKSKSQTTTGAASNNNTASASTTSSPTTAANNNSNSNNTDKSAQKKSTSSRPPVDPSATGMMFANLSIVQDTLQASAAHQKVCKCALQMSEITRSGFEVIHKMSCNFCKRTYELRSGPKPVDDATTKKRGPKTNQLNMTVANAMHSAAIPVAQMEQFCMEVGCIAPSETALHQMMIRRKKATKEVAEEVLRNNRREHVRELKKLSPDNFIEQKKAKIGKHTWEELGNMLELLD